MQVFDSDISLGLKLRNNLGELEVDYEDVKIHTRDYKVALDGSSDISKALEMMLISFKVFFEEELTGMLSSRLLDIVKDALDEKVVVPKKENARFQTSLIADPIVEAHYVSFLLDGAYTGTTALIQNDYPKMPLILLDDTHKIQSEMLVSAAMLNSAFDTLQTNGKLRYEREVTSAFMNGIFDNFEQVFGKDQNVTVTLEPVKTPTFVIAGNESSLAAEIEIQVMNPFSVDEGYEVIRMRCNVEASVDFELYNDEFALIASLSNSTMTITELKTYFYSEVEIEDLNGSVIEPLTELFT